MKIFSGTLALALLTLTLSWNANATVTGQVNLGTHNLPNELRGHCPNVLNHCRTEVRSVQKKLTLHYSYPSGDTIRRHIIQCGAVAAATAGITSLILSPAVAQPVFEAAFEVCLRDRIDNDISDRIDFELEVEGFYSNWSTH